LAPHHETAANPARVLAVKLSWKRHLAAAKGAHLDRRHRGKGHCMERVSNSGRIAAAALCLAAAGVAQAGVVPDYYFNGPISFDASNGILSVATGVGGAELFQSSGLPANYSVNAGNELGSEVVLSMNLVPNSIVDNGYSTTASFSTASNYLAALYLGNGSGGTSGSPVLTGTLSDLQVSGIDGNNAGVLTGYLHPTGGLAYSYFSDPSDVIALDFDLSTNFSATMYAAAFSGQINGQVESVAAVPLPSTWPLLVSGLGLCGLAARRHGIGRSPT